MSQQMAATAMHLWRDSLPGANWSYDQGVVLQGLQSVWHQSGNGDYFSFIKKGVDRYVGDDGSIRTYKFDSYTLDNVLTGRSVMMLYNVLGAEKYYKAASLLYKQLGQQPRVPQGGFWHKKRYTNQMWLDGLYMAEPFYAEYAHVFHKDTAFNDIAKQFILMEKYGRDERTGLLYHAWDEAKAERWADKQTGKSPTIWARSMGWYMMALVDVLDYFPQNHPKRAELLAILNRTAAAVRNYQDKSSGVWWQVMDKGGEKDNYLEASASCMFVYTFAKAAREGYLPADYLTSAQKGYQGIIKEFVTKDANGYLQLNGICSAIGLGGDPVYRDGSYQYYTSVRPVSNEPKGIGTFMLMAVEMERLEHRAAGKGRTVLLDSYFNNEHRKDITGQIVPYHYKWDEYTANGYSFFGWAFNNYGFDLKTLNEVPTAANLKAAKIYIITDPDIPKENPDTKYIEQPHIKAIADWVKQGGTLVVLNNDTGNAEFKHLNLLMAKFGIQFNENSVNRVEGKHFEQGAIAVPAGNELFKTAKSVYIKELSTLALTQPAKPVLTDKDGVIVAVAKYGKGTVFAVGDPWFYNEYVDGRKLPAQYENFKAMNDLVAWLASL